ncbi:helix-turn-helix domain-containing protein [Enterococcus nangangensis]|uniref:helix-turn-helix domain-containing protein n=1 Tax=Enterococcus nangangensis TaxID=2559926 RepID=UPI0010F6A96B|nr:helix-turn-helix domain-containing protein [Enterococcus nangangensis]
MKLYSVEEVAARLQVSTRTIRNYLRNNKLKGQKVGGQWRFTEDEIVAFLGLAPEVTDTQQLVKKFLQKQADLPSAVIIIDIPYQTAAELERQKNIFLTQFNEVYEDGAKRFFHFQRLAEDTTRLTIEGSLRYVQSFSSWVYDFLEKNPTT